MTSLLILTFLSIIMFTCIVALAIAGYYSVGKTTGNAVRGTSYYVGRVVVAQRDRRRGRKARNRTSPPPYNAARPSSTTRPSPNRSTSPQRPAAPVRTIQPSPASRPSRWRGRRATVLPPEAQVTFGAEREASGIDEIFAALDRELVGLYPVKQKVSEIGSLLLVDQARHKFGLDAPRPNLHMCFTGAPGTGKTTVALRMAELLHRLGYLEQGHLVHVMRDDLVGEYIGQTAPRTKRVLERAFGGVLFIDEAYYLYRAHDSKDYGQEVIDILLQVMENDRDKLVVIVAGYKDRMEEFFESNPGMRSRIAHHLDFAAYEVDELVAIGRAMLDQASYYFSDEAEEEFWHYLDWRMRQPHFANARSVRNELEQARLRHAYRLTSDLSRSWNRDDLMRLEPPDILGSRRFDPAATPDSLTMET